MASIVYMNSLSRQIFAEKTVKTAQFLMNSEGSCGFLYTERLVK